MVSGRTILWFLKFKGPKKQKTQTMWWTSYTTNILHEHILERVLMLGIVE